MTTAPFALPEPFVEQCEKIALDLRGELGLSGEARLDPLELFEQRAIEVHTIERFRETLPDEVARLTGEGADAFSAATVFCGTRCLVLVNPSQSDREKAVSIAHELAHLELEHEPTWPLFDERGRRRSWCANEEAEAEYFAGALLVPRSGLKSVLRSLNRDVRGVASHFGVDIALLKRRLAESGGSRVVDP